MSMADEQRKTQNQKTEQPSGYTGESPATAGGGEIKLRSETPENREGQINPSSPPQATEGPSTNLASPVSSGREGMGSMGYVGSKNTQQASAHSRRRTR